MEQGKNLQKKVFKIFDRVDEMSQRYSEDMESATNIAMQSLPLVAMTSFFTPIVAIGVGVYKGKINIESVGKVATDILAKFSSLLKTKSFKNIVKDVSNNVEKAGKYLPKNKEDEVWALGLKTATKENMVDEIEQIIKSRGKNSDSTDKIIKNLRKIAKNIPDEEFNLLKNSIAENPHVITEALKKGKIPEGLFKSDTLRKLQKTAVFSWAGANIGGLVLINMYLAELQKKSGKIGTMKAIQSLEDPRGFVDQYSVNNDKQSKSSAKTKQKHQAPPFVQRLMNIKNDAA